MTVILCIESGNYSPPVRRFGICNSLYTRDCVIQILGLYKCINNFILMPVICTSGVVITIGIAFRLALQWSHMSVKASQNHQQLYCFFQPLVQAYSRKVSKLPITNPLWGKICQSPVPVTQKTCPCDDVIMVVRDNALKGNESWSKFPPLLTCIQWINHRDSFKLGIRHHHVVDNWCQRHRSVNVKL